MKKHFDKNNKKILLKKNKYLIRNIRNLECLLLYSELFFKNKRSFILAYNRVKIKFFLSEFKDKKIEMKNIKFKNFIEKRTFLIRRNKK